MRIVALGLPTSWQSIATTDEITARILAALNWMLLDTLAAIACKDYTDHRRRQAEGIAKAKTEGAYKGRRALTKGMTWSEI